MKKLLLNFLCATLLSYSCMAQSDYSLCLYKDGTVFKTFPLSSVDYVKCDKSTESGFPSTEYLTQIIVSKGVEYRKAIADMDSVSIRPTHDSRIEVYSVGTEANSKTINVAKVWKNGEVLDIISDGINNVWCQNMAFVNDDYYVVGYAGEGLYATLWKNGVSSYLPGVKAYSNATDIVVSGSDYYISGYAYDADFICKGIGWKNGEYMESVTNGTSLTLAYSILPWKGNLYYATECGADPNQDYAAIYKNGTELYKLTDDPKNGAYCRKVCIYNNDLYSCGTIVFSESAATPRVWKNGEILYNLTKGNTSAKANHMTMYKGHTYVCGTDTKGGIKVAVIWKDDKELYSYPTSSEAKRIEIYDGDIYTCGYALASNPYRNIACIWKNGELLYDLTGNAPEHMGNNMATGLTIKEVKPE